ncbi:hypothetical protein [Streptomyces genisteinicus]|uniref:hypothetical protein n=1 Tax=Streptomyces genisteinicus TaxID=2768068 RepID=UPI001FE243E5|nr:hypothetical protein [Streptomyces genisteinicus]
MTGAAPRLATTSPRPAGPRRGGVGRSLLALFAVLVLAWAIAAGNTALAYVSLGNDVIPIVTGCLLAVGFVIVLRLLHHAWWLALLSVVPGLFVLVGSVQYAPEAALERRGVRETAVVTADSAAGTESKDHRFTLTGPGGELDETLRYRGSDPGIRVGDRIEIVRDPEGVVAMERADEVDPEARLGGLVGGAAAWSVITVAAGWRGHYLRRSGRTPFLDGV